MGAFQALESGRCGGDAENRGCLSGPSPVWWTEGRAVVERIDRRVDQLPGLGGLRLLSSAVTDLAVEEGTVQLSSAA